MAENANPAPAAEAAPEKPRRRARRTGVVVSARMQKSVVVSVERLVMHKLYKRLMTRSTKLMAHDEQGACKEGDVVEIEETRPTSKRKRWTVKRVIGRKAGGDRS
jgi:small subunit ribosomal protein S17